MALSLDLEGAKALALGIIEQAVYDWRCICNKSVDVTDENKSYRITHVGGFASFYELKRFFKSDWCEWLCSLVKHQDFTPEKILAKLEAEREEAKARGGPRIREKKGPARYEYNGETRTLNEWAKLIGVSRYMLQNRLIAGWTFEEALTGVRKRNEGSQTCIHA